MSPEIAFAQFGINGPLTIGPEITIQGQDVQITGEDYASGDGQDTVINQGLISFTGSFNIGTNSFENQGTIRTTDGGTMATPGDFDNSGTLTLEPSQFNVGGTYIQESTGVLNIGIGGPSPGSQLGQIDVKGATDLDGTLHVDITK